MERRRPLPRASIAGALATVLVLGGSSVLARGQPLHDPHPGPAAKATAAGLPRPTPGFREQTFLRVRLASLQAFTTRTPLRGSTNLLVDVTTALPITSRPGGGTVVGAMPAGSRYYHVPVTAWVMRVSGDGRYGLVAVPYSSARKTGWIPLQGLHRSHTAITVRVDLSRHRLVVERRGRPIMRVPAATGAPTSPTPPGRYFVTDRVPFDPSGPLGAFAFGISGIQTHLPAGWSGGDQLAIHGTNDPSSIGTSASAGCLRVSASAVERLKRLLRLGTPIIIGP